MNNKLYLIYLICFIFLIKPLSSFVSFVNPYCISLSDGRILVIHKYGISICNSFLTEIIENIITFTETEEISTEAALSRITSASENGYIFCIINDKIYIFNENGDLLSQNFIEILTTGETADYYTLTPIRKTTSVYYFVVGYVYNSAINLLLCSFSFSNNNTQIIFTLKNKKYSYFNSNGNYLGECNIQNKGLSCQYLSHNTRGEVLNCFCLIYVNSIFDIASSIFTVTDSKITMNNYLLPVRFNFGEIKCIKSAIPLDDRSKTIVCFNLINGGGRCLLYDINYIYSNIKYIYWDDFFCKDVYYGLKIRYYKETDEYIFSCFSNDGEFLFIAMDNDFNIIEDFNKKFDCDICGYSIIY